MNPSHFHDAKSERISNPAHDFSVQRATTAYGGSEARLVLSKHTDPVTSDGASQRLEVDSPGRYGNALVKHHLKYPLVNIQETMENHQNHHFLAGSIHYFDWAIFNSYVKLPEGIWEVKIEFETQPVPSSNHAERSLTEQIGNWVFHLDMRIPNSHWLHT